MTDILTDFSPRSLGAAVQSNLFAFFREFRRSTLAETDENADRVRWHTAIPHPWFNGVLSTRPPAAGVDKAVQDTLAYFQARGVADLTWWCEPDLGVEAWRPVLLPRGFRFDDRTPGMAMDLDGLPPDDQAPAGLRIRRVDDEALLPVWVETFIAGFGLPAALAEPISALFASLGLGLPIQHYLGDLDDRPVATCTLFLGAGVAGIYNVATRPEARGRGVGAAMTAQPLRWAREAGYRAGVLQSSEMGFNVYRRLGFQRLVAMEHFYWKFEPAGAAE